MNLELTVEQVSTLHLAVLSRIQTVKKLIEGWKQYPDQYTPQLIEAYTEELRILEETEKIVL